MSQAAGPFANLDEGALRALAPHGAVRSFSKNAVVVSEGDETDSLYILLSGRVKAFVSEEDGREVCSARSAWATTSASWCSTGARVPLRS